MRKLRFSAFFLLVFMLLQLFGCAVNIPLPDDITSADEAQAVGLSISSTNKSMRVGEYGRLGVNVKIDYNYALKWYSDNPAVATVDSNGRVDAISVGKATITAKVEKASVSCVVTVKEAKEENPSTSTAITTDKNKMIIDQNRTNKTMNLYALLVNLETGCITAYTYNSQGVYNIAVRAMACATAADPSFYDTYENGDSSDTVFYHIDDKVGDANGWNSKDKDTYYRYRTNFSLEGKETISFTSCAYSKKAAAALIAEEYNKLGTASTEGDVRLSLNDARWIYDNCESGTQIRFVSENGHDSLGVPKTIKISENCDIQNWDPTDPDSRNPFLQRRPVFKGVDELNISMGEVSDLKAGVEVYDTGMNLMPGGIRVDANIPKDKAGRYVVSYYYTDALKRTGRADRVVVVN